jgi:DNA excision repair protein ERCC-6-like 2
MLTSSDSFYLCRLTPSNFVSAKDANMHAIELGRIKGQELSSKLKEIYIQRKKEDVLADELPDKDERIVFCEPSELQKELYEYILRLPDFVLLRESSGPCDCGKYA